MEPRGRVFTCVELGSNCVADAALWHGLMMLSRDAVLDFEAWKLDNFSTMAAFP